MNRPFLYLLGIISLLVLSGCKDAQVEITTLNYDIRYAALDQPYDFTVQAKGGSNSFAFSIASGALPFGLNLDANLGVISGTPTIDEEDASFTIRATDKNADNPTDSISYGEKEFSLLVVNSPHAPDAYEALNDDGYDTSNNLRMGESSQLHNFHLPSDQDIYAVDLTGVEEGTQFVIEIQGVDGEPTGNIGQYLHRIDNPTGDPVHHANSGVLMDSNSMMYMKKGNADRYYLYVSSHGLFAYTISMFEYANDKYEEDDSAASTTNVVYPGETAYQFHTFTEGDEDWISLDFSSIASGTLYEFFSEHRSGGNFDGTKLSLYDDELNLLAENDFRDWVTSSDYARIYWYFEPGQYYLRVVPDSANGDATDLTINEHVGVHPGPDDYEALNDFGFDTENVVTVGSSQQHTLHVTGDEDFYRLDLSAVTAGTDITITAGRDAQKSPPGSRFYLFEENGTQLMMEWGHLGVASAPFTVTNPGIYYIKVDSFFDDTGHYLLTVE